VPIRALILYFGCLALLLVALALVAFRPTPLTGFDGSDLASSVNSTLGPDGGHACKQVDDAWNCPVWNNTASGPVTYRVEDPDWLGCWNAERVKPPLGPRTLSGCITLLDHT